jgi:hypothetical protein
MPPPFRDAPRGPVPDYGGPDRFDPRGAPPIERRLSGHGDRYDFPERGGMLPAAPGRGGPAYR